MRGLNEGWSILVPVKRKEVPSPFYWLVTDRQVAFECFFHQYFMEVLSHNCETRNI